MMVMYYWLVFLIIFTKSQNCSQISCSNGQCCGGKCCPVEQCCDSEPNWCCDPMQIHCGCGYNYAQKNSEMQDGSVNKTVAHNYYDNWWIIIAIVAVIMVVCCGGVALCWLKKVKVKAYGHVGKENEAVEEEMELQETQS
eukprot:420273_1